MNTFFAMTFPAAVMLLVLGSVAEWILSLLWAPFYFRHGLPILQRSYTVPVNLDLAAHIPQLEHNLQRSWWRAGIAFRALSPRELAFRNTSGSRNPVQGLARLDAAHGRLTIAGYLYASYLLFPLLILPFLAGGLMPLELFPFVLLLITAVLIMTILLQRRRYGEIMDTIARTVGGQRQEGETAVTSPDFTPEVWGKPAYDPLAPTATQPGLSKLEAALIVILIALALAVGLFLFLFFSGV
ncbi:MAG: hypothetical protein KC441_09465 [Anaerolineales bacterium]|nr:hypothetical protein [Anaerolineales bacterium]